MDRKKKTLTCVRGRMNRSHEGTEEGAEQFKVIIKGVQLTQRKYENQSAR